MSTDPSPKRQRVEAVDMHCKASVDKPAEPVELARGAEAVLTKRDFMGRPSVVKHRLVKPYRHPQLDTKLRTRRLLQEARVLLRLRKAGIRVPAVYAVDPASCAFTMEYVGGASLKEHLRACSVDGARAVLEHAGRAVARMHLADIVHGDLTTSNIIVTPAAPDRRDHDAAGDGGSDGGSDAQRYAVCLIDFGLSHGNGTEEDLAVDLYVLERAVISAHAEHAAALNAAFLAAYSQHLARPPVLARLEEVRARGRKRDMTG